MAYEESTGHVTDNFTCPKRSNRYPNTLSAISRKQMEVLFIA